jgi:hypothetical protein
MHRIDEIQRGLIRLVAAAGLFAIFVVVELRQTTAVVNFLAVQAEHVSRGSAGNDQLWRQRPPGYGALLLELQTPMVSLRSRFELAFWNVPPEEDSGDRHRFSFLGTDIVQTEAPWPFGGADETAGSFGDSPIRICPSLSMITSIAPAS